MAFDLETLRQNRARLEAVIVDAHKLLEEKEEDVRTLERDLELARLAGEKHLERVAEVFCRYFAASRAQCAEMWSFATDATWSVCLSVCLSVCVCVCLSVCLSVVGHYHEPHKTIELVEMPFV